MNKICMTGKFTYMIIRTAVHTLSEIIMPTISKYYMGTATWTAHKRQATAEGVNHFITGYFSYVFQHTIICDFKIL